MQEYQSKYELKKIVTRHLYVAVGSVNKEVSKLQNLINEYRELETKDPSQPYTEEVAKLLTKLTLLAAARKEVENVITRYRHLS